MAPLPSRNLIDSWGGQTSSACPAGNTRIQRVKARKAGSHLRSQLCDFGRVSWPLCGKNAQISLPWMLWEISEWNTQNQAGRVTPSTYSTQQFLLMWLWWPFIRSPLCPSVSPSVRSHSATPWAVACQAPLSMRFSRQEHWSGLRCPPPGESSQPRDQTQLFGIAGRVFTVWATRGAQGTSNPAVPFDMPTLASGGRVCVGGGQGPGLPWKQSVFAEGRLVFTVGGGETGGFRFGAKRALAGKVCLATFTLCF